MGYYFRKGLVKFLFFNRDYFLGQIFWRKGFAVKAQSSRGAKFFFAPFFPLTLCMTKHLIFGAILLTLINIKTNQINPL